MDDIRSFLFVLGLLLLAALLFTVALALLGIL